MAVTITDIAERAAVTKGTVSKVLNNRHSAARISDATKDRVLDAVKELNYQPSFLARSLARGKTNTIGLICGDIHTPHFAELASCALHEAEVRGYHLLLSLTEWNAEKELACLDTLLSRQVDGILMVPAALRPDTPQYQSIVRNHFPIVMLGACIEGLSSVSCDIEPGMDEAVTALKLRGHKRIGFVQTRISTRKSRAFMTACQTNGVTPVEYFCGLEMSGSVEVGRRLAADDSPHAIIVRSDYTAMGVIRGLRDGGKEVPRDVDVIGIDGTQWGAYATPALTSIYQNRSEMISSAMDILLERVKDPSLSHVEVTIPTRLVDGETVKPMPE